MKKKTYYSVIPISVVMSVYNGEKYVGAAIKSILNQSFKNYEFIIIDDGSTDRSSKIIKSYQDERIVFIQQENKGLASSLNIGIKLAKGKYIARMDADDISLSSRFELQYNFLQNTPECVAVGSNASNIDKNGNTIYISNNNTQWVDIKNKLPKTPFYHSSVMFRKSIAKKCEYYHTDFIVMQDIVLFNKMAKYGELRNLPMPLIKYRITESALCRRTRGDSKTIWKIIHKVLNNDQISTRDKKVIIRIKSKRKEKFKRASYYLFIGKKYLWTNFNSKLAKKNILLSIKTRPQNIEAWLCLILSLFPQKAISMLYKILKRVV